MEKLLEKLNLSFNNQVGDLEFVNSRMTLTQIALKIGVSQSDLKKSYLRGLRLLRLLVQAHSLFERYEKIDFVNKDTEKAYADCSRRLSYIPYIGIDEFSVLYYKDKKLLEALMKIFDKK